MAADLVNTATLAKVVRCSDKHIRDLVREGIIAAKKVKGSYKFDLLLAVGQFSEHYQNLAYKKQATDESLEKEKLEAEVGIKKAKRRRAELELEEFELNLLDAHAVEEIMTDHVYRVRAAFLSLPGRLAKDVAETDNPNEVADIIKRTSYEILTELADYKYNVKEFEKRLREREGMDAKKELAESE